MSAKRPPQGSSSPGSAGSPGKGLRLVSDEGRTVAAPPTPPAQPSAQPSAQPPAHPSMPPSNGHLDNGSASAPNGHSGTEVQSLGGEMRPSDLRALDDSELYSAVEAVLLVATEPVPADVLASVTAAPLAAVATVCDELAREYAHDERGFTLARVAGGYQLQTAADTAEFVERFIGGRRSARLSAAAMETLAVVAYKQPISRAHISAIRGVNADGVVRTLADQGYIDEVGRDPGPGNAALLGTTALFLERLGLDSLNDLPSLAELSPEADAADALDRLALERHG